MGVINLAYYEKKDWEKFLNSIDDRDSMHDTWEEWHQAYLVLKTRFIMEGFVVHDFKVNIDDLIDYCKKRGIKNNGKARSQFVQQG